MKPLAKVNDTHLVSNWILDLEESQIEGQSPRAEAVLPVLVFLVWLGL